MLDAKLTSYVEHDASGARVDLGRYQVLPGGKGVVVPRRLPGGGNPMVDPRKGASQFTVVDIDEDEHGNLTTTVHPPGTTDTSGNPIPKEEQCSSPDPKTSSPVREPQANPLQTPSPPPGKRRRRASPTCPSPSTSSAAELTRLELELSRLQGMIQKMQDCSAPQPASPQSRPSSDTSASPAVAVEFRAPYGVFRCEVAAIQRDEGLLVLVYRADSPVQFIPAEGANVQVLWPGGQVEAKPHGLAFRLSLSHTYLVVLLSVVQEL